MGIVVFNRFWKPVETTIIWQKKLLTHFNPKHSIAAAMFAHKLCRSACWLPKNLRQKLNYLSTSFLNLPLKAIARNYQKTPGQELNFLSLPLKAIARNSTPRQRLNFLSFPFLNLLPLKAIACNYQKRLGKNLAFSVPLFLTFGSSIVMNSQKSNMVRWQWAAPTDFLVSSCFHNRLSTIVAGYCGYCRSLLLSTDKPRIQQWSAMEFPCFFHQLSFNLANTDLITILLQLY